MIVERSDTDKIRSVYAFSTFFYPKLKEGGHHCVRRWTKKTDIFSHSLILVVFLRIHWCLASIDMEKKTITYHDSMGGNNVGCLQTLAEYLKEEHLTRKGVSVFIKEYVLFL